MGVKDKQLTCCPFSQADMRALKVTTVGLTPSLFISSKISRAILGFKPFSQAEMAALYLRLFVVVKNSRRAGTKKVTHAIAVGRIFRSFICFSRSSAMRQLPPFSHAEMAEL